MDACGGGSKLARPAAARNGTAVVGDVGEGEAPGDRNDTSESGSRNQGFTGATTSGDVNWM
jgi:hypothetical protein